MFAVGTVFGSINTTMLLYFIHKHYIKPYITNKISIGYNIQISKLLQEHIDNNNKSAELIRSSMKMAIQNQSIKEEAGKLVAALDKVNIELMDENVKNELLASVYKILNSEE